VIIPKPTKINLSGLVVQSILFIPQRRQAFKQILGLFFSFIRLTFQVSMACSISCTSDRCRFVHNFEIDNEGSWLFFVAVKITEMGLFR